MTQSGRYRFCRLPIIQSECHGHMFTFGGHKLEITAYISHGVLGLIGAWLLFVGLQEEGAVALEIWLAILLLTIVCPLLTLTALITGFCRLPTSVLSLLLLVALFALSRPHAVRSEYLWLVLLYSASSISIAGYWLVKKVRGRTGKR